MRKLLLAGILAGSLLFACGESPTLTVQEFADECAALASENRESNLDTWGDYVAVGDRMLRAYSDMSVLEELEDFRAHQVSLANAVKDIAETKEPDAKASILELLAVFAISEEEFKEIKANLSEDTRQILVDVGCISE